MPKHELGNWCLNDKGYPRFTSGVYRNKYVHRVSWERIAGIPLPDGWHIHHQDFDKTNFCGCNLIAMPPELNTVVSARRCPYTEHFMSVEEYRTQYGGLHEEVPF